MNLVPSIIESLTAVIRVGYTLIKLEKYVTSLVAVLRSYTKFIPGTLYKVKYLLCSGDANKSTTIKRKKSFSIN